MILISLRGFQPWRYLCTCTEILEIAFANAFPICRNLAIMLTINSCTRSKFKEQQATMFNEEATQWPPYVENYGGGFGTKFRNRSFLRGNRSYL